MIQTKRVQALDVTRGIAVFGMIFMNFKISVLFDYKEGYSFLGSQEGRFGALFIFLAGMGIALMNRRAVDDPEVLRRNRIKLAKRSLFLFVLGMIFSLYWPADIFHFYAFYILLCIPLIRLSAKALFALALVPPVIFLGLNYFINWESGWNWESLQYSGFYSVSGFFKNLMFNGFHPVFPWISFMLTGMAAAKMNLTDRRSRIRACIISVIILAASELLSFLLNPAVAGSEILYLLSTRAMPPLPLFVISAGAQNFLILNLILLLSDIKADSKLLNILSETGKMVMTHYILHLILGLIPLFILKNYLSISIWFVAAYSAGYFFLTVALTYLWKKRFSRGPFETLMRKLTD